MASDVMDTDLVLRIGDAVASVPAQVRYTDEPGAGVLIDGIAVEICGNWVGADLVTEVLGASEVLHQAVADHAAGRREDARCIARAE